MTLSPRTDSSRPTAHAIPSVVAHGEPVGELSAVGGSLHRAYDEPVGAAIVQTEIQRVADRFTGARIRAFVPLFVRRYAGARLRAIQRDQERTGAAPGARGQG